MMKHLTDGFLASLERHPDRPALEAGDVAWTYRELAREARAIAAVLARDHATARLIAVWADRSAGCYAAILGALLSGKGYVALPPGHGDEKLARMLRAVGLPPVAAPRAGKQRLDATFAFDDARLTFVDLSPAGHPVPVATAEIPATHAPAYVAFTSGSTGEPKGVAVTHANAAAYLASVLDAYRPVETDRISGAFDLGFDASVHDMFLAWSSGACLCVVPDGTPAEIAAFLRERKLTVWFSLPHLVADLAAAGCLSPGAFPTLRLSLFGGEPLPRESVRRWREAAPGSLVENLYGPTETTIAIARHRCDPEPAGTGLCPIGRPFPGHEARLVDGELYLNGPQVTAGYLNDERKTRARFVEIPGAAGSWFRTGDLVREEGGVLHFVGRRDNQIKVRGQRIELEEIEQALRDSVGTLQSAVVPWRVENGVALAVVGFVVMRQAIRSPRGEPLPDRFWREGCVRRLPREAVPRMVFMVPSFPLSASGKLDRDKIARLAAILMETEDDAA